MIDITGQKNQKRFQKLQDVSTWQKAGLFVFLVLLISAPKWVPIVLGIAFEVGKLTTYVTACFALFLSAYATLQAYYIKKQERDQSLSIAKYTLYADTLEILQEYKDLRQRVHDIQEVRNDLWNQMIDEFLLIEKRFEKKQEQLTVLSRSFAPQLFPMIQRMYLEMLKLTSRGRKYHIRTDDLETAIFQQRKNRQKIIEEMAPSRNKIISMYSDLRQVVEGLGDLPNDIKHFDCDSQQNDGADA